MLLLPLNKRPKPLLFNRRISIFFIHTLLIIIFITNVHFINPLDSQNLKGVFSINHQEEEKIEFEKKQNKKLNDNNHHHHHHHHHNNQIQLIEDLINDNNEVFKETEEGEEEEETIKVNHLSKPFNHHVFEDDHEQLKLIDDCSKQTTTQDQDHHHYQNNNSWSNQSSSFDETKITTFTSSSSSPITTTKSSLLLIQQEETFPTRSPLYQIKEITTKNNDNDNDEKFRGIKDQPSSTPSIFYSSAQPTQLNVNLLNAQTMTTISLIYQRQRFKRWSNDGQQPSLTSYPGTDTVFATKTVTVAPGDVQPTLPPGSPTVIVFVYANPPGIPNPTMNPATPNLPKPGSPGPYTTTIYPPGVVVATVTVSSSAKTKFHHNTQSDRSIYSIMLLLGTGFIMGFLYLI